MAVLNAWESAEQQLYAYVDEPPAPLRADLVAGETTAELFPKLADYYMDPALQSENVYLGDLKMASLNGPSSFNLGTPTVTALTATSATVSSCITDSGTTTAAGKRGPLTLDGYDPTEPYAEGIWNLQLVGNSWKVVGIQSTSVAKC